MSDLFLGDSKIEQKYTEILMKKLDTEKFLKQKDITRDKYGNLIIENNPIIPTRLTNNEINNFKEDLRNYDRILAELAIKIQELKKEENKISYGDIYFDLHNRTLEIGTMTGDKKIRKIDKIPEELKHLKKNVTTSIMLLYCIIRNADENNDFELKKTFNEYDNYIKEYKTQTGFNPTGSFSDFKTYVSKLRQIFKFTGSKYEITKGKKRSIRLKLKTNK